VDCVQNTSQYFEGNSADVTKAAPGNLSFNCHFQGKHGLATPSFSSSICSRTESLQRKRTATVRSTTAEHVDMLFVGVQ